MASDHEDLNELTDTPAGDTDDALEAATPAEEATAPEYVLPPDRPGASATTGTGTSIAQLHRGDGGDPADHHPDPHHRLLNGFRVPGSGFRVSEGLRGTTDYESRRSPQSFAVRSPPLVTPVPGTFVHAEPGTKNPEPRRALHSVQVTVRLCRIPPAFASHSPGSDTHGLIARPAGATRKQPTISQAPRSPIGWWRLRGVRVFPNARK